MRLSARLISHNADNSVTVIIISAKLKSTYIIFFFIKSKKLDQPDYFMSVIVLKRKNIKQEIPQLYLAHL